MIPSFKNLAELLRKYPDDASCRSYLEAILWNGIPTCPECGCQKTYKLKGGKIYKCANNTCYKKFSVTLGTVFENTNIPLNIWFAAVYLATSHKKGISSVQLSKDLGITQKTAWFMLHRIREAFKEKAPELLNDVIEVDETYVGGKNKNRHAAKKINNSQGRSIKDKTPVFGLLQRGGKVFTTVIANTKSCTLNPILSQSIKDGALLVTDEYVGYSNVPKGFNHVVLNHKEGEYVRGAFHTNNIEGFWAILKRGIYGIYHCISPKHLNRYCHEFAYRYNYRKLPENERFNLSLKSIYGRLKYNDLTRNI